MKTDIFDCTFTAHQGLFRTREIRAHLRYICWTMYAASQGLHGNRTTQFIGQLLFHESDILIYNVHTFYALLDT